MVRQEISFASYLLARLELLAVEAVEEEGEEEVEHHEVPHDEGGQEDGKAGLGNALKSNKINFESFYSWSSIFLPLKCLTTFASALMQSQSGSIHSPQRMRKIIMKE